jgi:hypothetical protein
VILSSIPRSFAIPLEIPTCQRRRHRLNILQEPAPGLLERPWWITATGSVFHRNRPVPPGTSTHPRPAIKRNSKQLAGQEPNEAHRISAGCVGGERALEQ